MYLLDTNVIAELRRPERADRNVSAWAASRLADEFFLSAITILEIQLGALLMARRDAAQSGTLGRWIENQILPRFEGRILPVDTAVALCCAGLHVPDRRAERDALIAATGLVYSMIVVTRNVADFAPTGVRILNPWDSADLISPH